MPIIIKAQSNESTNDLIKKFKKITVATDIVQKAKDRRYYQKPSQVKAVRKIAIQRLKKRMRSLKKMKNISPQALVKMAERISS